MRILHLSSRPQWCGESNRVLVICRGLTESGHDVVLGTAAQTALAERARAAGVAVRNEFFFENGCHPFHFMADIRRLRAMLAGKRYDIVHVHTSRDTWVAAVALGARAAAGRPLLLRTRHSSHRITNTFLHRWLYCGRVDHVVLPSRKIESVIAEPIRATLAIERRLHAIHSSVNVHRFDPEKVSRRSALDEFGLKDRFVIGLLGRVSYEKGHDTLIAALESVVKRGPRLKCLFIGDGAERGRIEGMVRNAGLADNVVFTGFRDDIPGILSAIDVLVMPSMREASPAVIKEAMAMNVAVIAADVGGVSEIVTHGRDGWLVAPGSSEALAEAILMFANDSGLRHSVARRGRETIVREFSDERLIERTAALYGSVVAGVGTGAQSQ